MSRQTIYTEAFRAKPHRINAVLDAFHYDGSNSMVDYFDTNFYRDITVGGVMPPTVKEKQYRP